MTTQENDDQIEEYLDKLMDLLDAERIEIKDRWWKDTTIAVDGYRFINCRFEDCTLTYRFPNFEFVGCALVGTDLLPERKHRRLATGETETV